MTQFPRSLWPVALALVIVWSGCTHQVSGAGPSESGHQGPAGSKRIVAAVQSEPESLYHKLNSSHARGGEALEEMVNAGLARSNDHGVLLPQLADRVPTTENGLWKVFPDGRMETTWTIREGARWHDGAPFTTDDLVFTATVVRDRDLAGFGNAAYTNIERVERIDDRTILVGWKRPFIQADRMFTRELAMPLPSHILEETYQSDKANLLQSPYWLREFVGTGPFRLKEYALGTHLTLEANDTYIGGRPKIDIVDVQIIPDQSTLITNLLAGSVQLTLGQTISFEQALQARDQWRDGSVATVTDNWVIVIPQLLNPTPAVVGDVNFRRAMLRALDRQEMVDTLQGGMAPIADSLVGPSAPEYKAIESRIVRYPYDQREAIRMIEGLGYSRGADGAMEKGGEKLSVSVYATADDQNTRPLFAVSKYWQAVGVATDPVIVPPQRASDREYRAAFPAFSLQAQPNGAETLWRHRSDEARIPSRNYSGNNYNRYMNPELDALIDKYLTTIPYDDRMEALGEAVNHMTDRATILGLYYRMLPFMISNRLLNVSPREEDTSEAWNAELWDVKS